MARARSIVVRLKAEVSDFQNKMGQASRSLSDFEKGQQKLGGAATTTMGRLVQSAQVNEREWSQVGSTLMVAGGAITGLGVAALKTGVQYNTLQQTTRAALTTIFQDGAKANAQMDALDDFARNSPFAKQVFIEAQQQMLGFGIEAQKVLPYLDSIQNAVAATGGSNQDIAELATVFSQVHANAKITARELMMFGQRGVDAATIIGEQMGFTGAEIREQITAGTLDAGEALDALAAGMDERFGGAAANVKETFEGAWDRIKAAWRDLSSELATPLVDPQGGGIAIDVLNGIADAMRRFIEAPAWVRNTALALGGLTGAAALGGGALMVALPRYVEFRKALETLSKTHPALGRLSSALGKTAKVAGTALATFVAVDAVVQLGGLSKGTENVTEFGRELRKGVDGLELMGIKSFSLDEAFERLQHHDLNDWVGDKITGPLFDIHGDAVRLTREFEMMGDQLAQIYASDPDLAAERFNDILQVTGATTAEMLELMPAYAIVLEELELEQEAAAETGDRFAGTLAGIGSSAEDAQEIMDEWAGVIANASASFGGVVESYDEVIAKGEELGWSSKQTMDEWIEHWAAKAKAARNMADNVETAMDQIEEEVPKSAQTLHKAFVKEMIDAGEGGAEALQTFVDGTPEQRQALIDEWAQVPDEMNRIFEEGLDDIEVEADTSETQAAVEELLQWVDENHPFLSIQADTDDAENSVNTMLQEWAEENPEILVDADVDPAEATSRELFNEWVTSTTFTGLDADSTPAEGKFNFLTGEWESEVTDTNLDADTTLADYGFIDITSGWSDTTTDTNLDANTGPAEGAFQGQTRLWSTTTTSTKIDADTTPAQSAWNSFKSGIGTIWTTIRTAVTGNYDGGFINPGKYEGGQILPGRQAGGTVPGPRAGRDNILWPLHSGGQILSQPLEGGEFVVRSSQAPRYTPELYAMNNGTFPTGMMERLYSSTSAGPMTVNVPSIDYDRLASMVVSAARSAPVQANVNVDGKRLLTAMASAQHDVTRGNPAAPILKQG